MSQTTLGDHANDSDADGRDADGGADWQPGSGSSPDRGRRCQGCNAHVTATFRRCFGDADNVAHHCPECVSGAMLRDGAARDPGYDTDGYSSRETITAGRFGNGRGL